MMNMQRKPAHPGRIIKNMHLKPLSLTITALADILGVSRKTLSDIVNERKPVTPDMALRLSRAFKTTPDLWLNLQKKHDLWYAMNNTSEWENVRQLRFPAVASWLLLKSLNRNLGTLETERFIVLIRREKFDYTKWRENLFDGLSGKEITCWKCRSPINLSDRSDWSPQKLLEEWRRVVTNSMKLLNSIAKILIPSNSGELKKISVI